ncbi:MAG: hypothetical protein AAF525_05610 [Pseudomonadota bacterium]
MANTIRMLNGEEWASIESAAKTFNEGVAVLPALTFLRETGCRPQEVRIVSAEHIDHDKRTVDVGSEWGHVVLKETIYDLVCSVAKENPVGPLFRDGNGKPWSSRALGKAVEVLAEKSSVAFSYYNLRRYKRYGR